VLGLKQQGLSSGWLEAKLIAPLTHPCGEEIQLCFEMWDDVVCVAAVALSEMKDAQKQDAADDKDEPSSTEMKTDAKSESENKEGVTKMDTIPASVAVTTSEPSADHWQFVLRNSTDLVYCGSSV